MYCFVKSETVNVDCIAVKVTLVGHLNDVFKSFCDLNENDLLLLKLIEICLLTGLSVQKLVENWRHKALLLFKLLLLRRKVLIYGAPAGPLSTALLTLVSLLPLCLEDGLTRAANVV